MLEMDLEIEELAPHEVTINGAKGKPHTFSICQLLLPAGIMLEAEELGKGESAGYRFAVFGDYDSDVQTLYDELLTKVTRGISQTYIKRRKRGPEIVGNRVVGVIACDEQHEDRIPLVIVDGKRYTWAQLGKMLMTFEGWQFKLDIVDSADDVFAPPVPTVWMSTARE